MKSHFFKRVSVAVLLWVWAGLPPAIAQLQQFEVAFQSVNFPMEFLPNWFGNEVSNSSSRIFQTIGQGRNGSNALAVQPISTFEGKIWVRLLPQNFENPEVAFYAKSIKNGTGTRAAVVFYSWGKSLTGDFTRATQLGESAEFANENQEFRKFSLMLPDELKGESEVVLSIDILYGDGSGSAARWVMDDFEFGDSVKDEAPPKVIGVKGYSANSLLIQFSEKVDPVFSIFPISYELDGRNPDGARAKNDSLVVLTFAEKLDQNTDYSLAIRQIPDLEGNFLQDTAIQFTFSDPTGIPWKTLVINELMPAPRADQDLPNVEYIEIFHAGENELRLEGVRLSNSRTETILGEYWIQPGEFVILAPESQALLLREFGPVLSLKSWPTLLNAGDQVTLKSAEGGEIDQIFYATSSWGGSDFANGGYSLELSNPFFLCVSSFLLKPSSANYRGTPGAQNSVFNPNASPIPPKLESVRFLDSLHLLLAFSEPLLPDLGRENFSFSPSLAIDTLAFVTEKELKISLQSHAKANEIYTMRLSGLKDCLGNFLPEQVVTFVLAESPKAGDLIINELLFNPRVGEPKFVEINNTSKKYLSLENWALANLDGSGAPDQIRVFGNPGLILEPNGYLAITTNPNALHLAYPKSNPGNFRQIPTLPSYPIAGGTVALLSPKMEILESFTYDEDFHHLLLRDPKGVSLERVSANAPATSPMNWQSASGSEGYGTPGKKNSQAISEEIEPDLIQVDPEVFDPDGSRGPTFTSIRYQLDVPGWVGTFTIYSAGGHFIQTLAQNQILGTDGLLTWSGTDVSGSLVRAGYYVLVVELYEPKGKTKVIKKTLVVATRL